MNVNAIRNFATGLLVATSVCTVVYFVGLLESSPTKAEEKPTVEEATAILTEEGYVIHTNEEWNELVKQVEAKQTMVNEPATDQVPTPNPPKEKIVYRTLLTVSEGMTSIDVGRALVAANIITSAPGFSRQVEEKGVATYLKPGTYQIESNMTVDQIISTIFKK